MKYKIGDTVILLSKFNKKLNIELSVVYKRMLEKNKNVAYIVDIYEDEKIYVINDSKNEGISGDFFNESDIELAIKYIRKQKINKINSLT